MLDYVLSFAFSRTELSFGELFACPFRVPPISLEDSFISVVAILHKCIYIKKKRNKTREGHEVTQNQRIRAIFQYLI